MPRSELGTNLDRATRVEEARRDLLVVRIEVD